MFYTKNKIAYIITSIVSVIAMYVIAATILTQLLGGYSVFSSLAVNSVLILCVNNWLIHNPPTWVSPAGSPSLPRLTVIFTLLWVSSQAFGLLYLENYGSIGFSDVNESISQTPIYILIIASAIIAPIAEEMLMRGFVQTRLTEIMSPRYAIILSTLIFSILHGNAVQFIIAFPLGLFLGIVYFQTKNILYPILIHMIYNTLAMLIPINSLQSMVDIPWLTFSLYALTGIILILLLNMNLAKKTTAIYHTRLNVYPHR